MLLWFVVGTEFMQRMWYQLHALFTELSVPANIQKNISAFICVHPWKENMFLFFRVFCVLRGPGFLNNILIHQRLNRAGALLLVLPVQLDHLLRQAAPVVQ